MSSSSKDPDDDDDDKTSLEPDLSSETQVRSLVRNILTSRKLDRPKFNYNSVKTRITAKYGSRFFNKIKPVVVAELEAFARVKTSYVGRFQGLPKIHDAIQSMDRELERLGNEYVNSSFREGGEAAPPGLDVVPRETGRVAYLRAHHEMLMKELESCKMKLCHEMDTTFLGRPPPMLTKRREESSSASSSDSPQVSMSSSSKSFISPSRGVFGYSELEQWLCDSRCFGLLVRPKSSWFTSSYTIWFVILRDDKLTFYKDWTQARESYFNKIECSDAIGIRDIEGPVEKITKDKSVFKIKVSQDVHTFRVPSNKEIKDYQTRSKISTGPMSSDGCAHSRSDWIKAIDEARTELGEATRLIQDIPAEGKVTMWKATREKSDGKKSPRLVYDYRLVNGDSSDKTSFVLLNLGTTITKHIWFHRVKTFVVFPERGELMLNQSHQDKYPTVLRFHTLSSCIAVSRILQAFDPFGHVARRLPRAHPRWSVDQEMMERAEEICQLELGKEKCNLGSIYSRIRRMLHFEFGVENYDRMKKQVKSIHRFYFESYDNRKIRDERMNVSPAKHARRRKSVLNETLRSDSTSFDVHVPIKLERDFGVDSSSFFMSGRSRYEVTGRVRLYENLLVDCVPTNQHDNNINKNNNNNNTLWSVDLSLCRLVLDDKTLTMRIYNHLADPQSNDNNNNNNNIFDLQFEGENSLNDWKTWLEAIGSNASNRPRIYLGKNDPFEEIILDLQKRNRKYQVRTSTGLLPNDSRNERDVSLIKRAMRHNKVASEKNLLVTDLLVESVLIQRRTQSKRAFSNPSVLDFKERRKIVLNQNVSFVDHAPTVFDTIRRAFGVNDESYLKSLSEPLEGGGKGDGASDMLFFHTADGKFAVKQVKDAELIVLHDMLESYFIHMLKNPDTLLCRFYGLLEIKSPHFKGILVVMNNVTHSEIIRSKAPAMIKFDLKGSSRGRVVDEKKVLKGTTAKDLNWTKKRRKIRLGKNMGKLLLEQLERDAQLLKANRILDYSLLLGVIRSDDAAIHAAQWDAKKSAEKNCTTTKEDWRLRSRWNLYHGGICGRNVAAAAAAGEETLEEKSEEKEKKFVQTSQVLDGLKILSRELKINHLDHDDPFRVHLEQHDDEKEKNQEFEIYYMGIIDILQDWTISKNLEHTVKTVTGGNSKDMSAVSPGAYYPRFVNFMKEEVVEN